MTEQKPSRLRRLTDFLKGKQNNENDYIEENLSGYSLKVIADKKLEERLEEWNLTVDLVNEPIQATTVRQYAEEIRDIIQTVNKTVSRVAGVYATGGDKGEGKELMSYWQDLASIYEPNAISVIQYWGTDESITGKTSSELSIKARNVFNFHIDTQKWFLKYANKVIMFCFKRIDITPRHVTTIQSMMPMMPGQEGGTTITGSGGRTSEDPQQVRRPKGGPYPPTMDNRVH